MKIVFFFLLLVGSSLFAEQRLILVTGCARSGTTFMAEVLKISGLEVGHEFYRSDGIVSWTMAVESDRTPWGPPYKEGAFKHIFHQVRDPLKSIASIIATEPKESWDFIKSFIPQIQNSDSRLVKAIKYWIHWNRFAEQKAEMTYQIEQLPHVLVEIGERIGYALHPSILDSIPKNTNHRNDYEYLYTWSDLQEILPDDLFQELWDLAAHYGYVL